MKYNAAKMAAAVTVFSLTLTGPYGVSGLATAAASNPAYSVVVNGQEVAAAQAEMMHGQLMVSVRPYVDALGGGVTWDGESRKVTVLQGGSRVALWVDSGVAYADGAKLAAPVPPYIKNGRSMVPAWWLAVRLGARVRFSGAALHVETNGTAASRGAVDRRRTGHPLENPSFYFPFAAGVAYDPYVDSWGDPRGFQGRSFTHEGTDIMARRGTPIVAVASGKVVRYGWNTLGGYRLTVQIDAAPQYRFYYAHLDRYAPGLYEGARVTAGQVIGYVGSTGEGPEGTRGKFVDHLHFGVYGPDGALNPYPFLRLWERNKAAQ